MLSDPVGPPRPEVNHGSTPQDAPAKCDDSRLTSVDLSPQQLEQLARRAVNKRMIDSGARETAEIFMQGVELLIKHGGTGMVIANSSQIVTIPDWPERVQIFYYGGEGKKHFQIITVWSGANGKKRHSVFDRELRDDQAKRTLPQEMAERLLKRKNEFAKKAKQQKQQAA